MTHAAFRMALPGGDALSLGQRACVMAILNVTPDSFSDGGQFATPDQAVAQAEYHVRAGADLLDIGGESTRPGSEEIEAQAELDRVMPVLDALMRRACPLPISIDTYKASVAHAALTAGARIVNDVHGFQREPAIAGVAADAGAPAIAMHWDTARDTDRDLIAEMLRYFETTLAIAEREGLARDRIILDPGFGFAKSMDENYQLLGRLGELATLGLPLLIGTSRKSMIGKLLGNEPAERLPGTIATTALAYERGGHIFRVHDVAANRDALRVAEATLYGPAGMESHQ